MVLLPAMNKKWILLLLVLSLMGAGLSLYSLNQHLKFVETGQLQKSFCTVSEHVDCDLMNTSVYSEFSGIPVAGLGLIFYVFMILVALTGLKVKPSKKSGLAFAFFISFFSILVTLWMAYLSIFQIKAVCLICMGMYVTNLLIFIFLPMAMGISWTDMPSTIQHYFRALARKPNALGFKPHLRLNLVFFFVVFGTGILILHSITSQARETFARIQAEKNNKGAEEFSVDDLIDLHYSQPALPIQYGRHPFLGNPNAKVVIIEFSDFQCPYCRVAAETLKANLAEYKNDAVLYYAFYPLDQACNPNIKNKFHDKSCMAASASVCANKKGKFWEMHDAIFKNQSSLSAEIIDKQASLIGIDLAWLHACMASPETKQTILGDIQLGEKAKVEGTPSIYLNGRKLNGWNRKDFFKAVIEEEITKTY
ncbi:MAG TPA: hypothetical protein DDW49_05935 [Deltaproteobacteria bacterium]|nr:hypothetical protein [Deltaproteobacteria bacterium]